MSENLSKKPSKSILKTSNSVEKQDGPSTSRKSKEQRFDEMNIMATFHPPDKDYGHMKIDEPKTPYAEPSGSSLQVGDQLDAKLLSAKLAASMNQPPREYDSSDSEPDSSETPDDKVHRLQFEKKRKMHYNEFQAIQLARQLLEEDEDDEADDCNDVRNEKYKSEMTSQGENTLSNQNNATSSKCPFQSKPKP